MYAHDRLSADTEIFCVFDNSAPGAGMRGCVCMLHVFFTLFGRTLLEGAAAGSSPSGVSQLAGLASVKKLEKREKEGEKAKDIAEI